MYYVNMYGCSLDFIFKDTRYHIGPWEHVDLPDEMHTFIEVGLPLLEVDYGRYAAESEKLFSYSPAYPSPEFMDLIDGYQGLL